MITYPELDRIVEDLHKVPLLVCSERGSGKSEAIKSLVKHAKTKYGDMIQFVVFDPSLSWWISSPIKNKVRVTENLILKNKIDCEMDTVYLIGELSGEDRKTFISTIINKIYRTRYNQILRYGPLSLSMEPLIVFIIEESQTMLGSYALRSKSPTTDILRDFISIGRNIGFNERGLSAILITQRLSEIATEISERCHLLLGIQIGDNNLRKIRRSTNLLLIERLKSLKQYHFVYYNKGTSKPFKFPRYLAQPVEVDPIFNTFREYNDSEQTINWTKISRWVIGLIVSWIVLRIII